jgi:hypothetical protein
VALVSEHRIGDSGIAVGDTQACVIRRAVSMAPRSRAAMRS